MNDSRLFRRAIALLLMMLTSAALAHFLRPTTFTADLQPKVDLEQLLPRQFGDWRELPQSTAQIVNPQQAELLSKIYSQTLSRTYINSQQHVVMLSIAYGVDQSKATQLHKPETCYPAQGFEVKFVRPATIQTKLGTLETTQMFAALGQRNEPITYWMRIGDDVIRGGLPQTIQRLKLGLFAGTVADGLLFRVSSISADTANSFSRQEKFARDLLDAASPSLRKALVGNAG
jgi:EpsI family protein